MRDVMLRAFELDALEARSLLSAVPIEVAPLFQANVEAVVQPLTARVSPLAKALAKIAGNYTGTVAVTGVHTRPVNVTLKETSKGALTGTLTSPQDSSIKVKITGKVTSTKAFTFTLSNGSHPGGAIAGSGTGSIKGKKLTIKMNFVQGSTSTPGTLTLSKA